MGQMNNGRVLIVDDEQNALKVLSAILSGEGYAVHQAQNVEKAIQVANENELDAVITDMKMPGRDGMQLHDYLAESLPDIPVIFLTAYGTVESAVSAMTRGAYYYFIKPPDYRSLTGILAKAVEQRRLKGELRQLRHCLEEKTGRFRIIGKNSKLMKIFSVVDSIKDSESNVLICGETGTGKELIARALHFDSLRRDKPFVAVNCAAIPSELIESELFGYEKGAFTGATGRRIGRMEQAKGGTLFLDEIGELELAVQSKLLRVLQEREVERVGGNQKISVDFRLISSTNRDLETEVAQGRFREDLFYRIHVVKVEIPSLRERKDDIPLLVNEFLKEFCAREKKLLTINPSILEQFQKYSWPGNIRQLRNVVERAVVLAKGDAIRESELPEELVCSSEGGPSVQNSIQTLKELEAQAIRETLEKCQGNKSQTAKMLGFSRKALYKRLRDFQIA